MLKKSIITFFGIGNLPVATGTFASFFSLILLLFLNYYLSKILFIIFFIILLIISFFLVKEHIVKLDIKDSKETNRQNFQSSTNKPRKKLKNNQSIINVGENIVIIRTIPNG